MAVEESRVVDFFEGCEVLKAGEREGGREEMSVSHSIELTQVSQSCHTSLFVSQRELSEMRAPPCSTNASKKMKFQGEPKKPPM